MTANELRTLLRRQYARLCPKCGSTRVYLEKAYSPDRIGAGYYCAAQPAEHGKPSFDLRDPRLELGVLDILDAIEADGDLLEQVDALIDARMQHRKDFGK